MPYKDDDGITHVQATDKITAWTQSHINACPKCAYRYGGPLYTEEEWKAYVAANKPQQKQVLDYDDCFPLEHNACEICGAQIFLHETHVEWHNKLGG